MTVPALSTTYDGTAKDRQSACVFYILHVGSQTCKEGKTDDKAPWWAPWSRSRDKKAYIHIRALNPPHASWTSCLTTTLPNTGLKQMKQRESKKELNSFKGRVVTLPSRSFFSREWQWLKHCSFSLPERGGAGSTHVHVREKATSLSWPEVGGTIC